MSKDFFSEMHFEGVYQYEKPFAITFVSLPGSLKTTFARAFSKRFQIYLLSNDYIRNYYYSFTDDFSEEKRVEIQQKVKEIQRKRIDILKENKISFVLDSCLHDDRDYETLQKQLDGYQIIRIFVQSDDEKNIERIQNTHMDYDFVYEGVLGDNVRYESSYPKEVYDQIKERKPLTASFDFTLDEDFHIEEIEDFILMLQKNEK